MQTNNNDSGREDLGIFLIKTNNTGIKINIITGMGIFAHTNKYHHRHGYVCCEKHVGTSQARVFCSEKHVCTSHALVFCSDKYCITNQRGEGRGEYRRNRSGISQDPGHQQTRMEGRGRSASAQKKQVRN
jgi:hypothetical protein